ncbi:MAG: nitroreductase family protein [Dehalococcoidia bacterium]|nr:nitroreductase family protein [Dehalococcoidia bacterium]
MPELLPALAERRARRAFEAKPVPDDVQEVLWRAVSVAPSHGNTQPTRLLVTMSPGTRDRMAEALTEGNRAWATAAPLFIAVAVNPAHAPPVKNRDGSERDLWQFNAGIATGNLLAQATALGLLAHPMAGFDEAVVRDIFGAPPEIRVLAVLAVGYPGSPEQLPEDLQAKETAPQRRLPLDHLVAGDRWRPENALSAREHSGGKSTR